MMEIDQFDLKLLRLVQADSSLNMDELAAKVGLSRNACWRRLKALEEQGVIERRVALLNAEAMKLGLVALVMVRTRDHEPYWVARFKEAVRSMPEVVGAHRMSGDLDYLLKVRVRDVKAYDAFYQRLISKIPAAEFSASFVMEDIKDTTALPV